MGILLWGVLPPVALLVYIYALDRVEHEPVGLVVKTLLFGCIAVIPAVILEMIGEGIVDAVLTPNTVAYNVVYYFIVVAGSEEFCKRFAMKRAVWNNPEFNYLFDAVLYCVAAALGFAIIENIEYMAIYGEGVALGRLIPVHTICGVFMGTYLGVAKMSENAGNRGAAKRASAYSLIFPMLIHGAYDYCVSSENGSLALAALLGVLVLTIIAFWRVHYVEKNDRPLFAGAAVQRPPQIDMRAASQVPPYMSGQVGQVTQRPSAGGQTARAPRADAQPGQSAPYADQPAGDAPQQDPYWRQ